MNTMAHLPHPAGQNLLGEWTSPMCSPHSRGASHSLTLQNAPSGSTVTLGKWGSKTVPVGNRLRAATPYRTAQAVSNALQGNTTGRPRPCPTRCKETPPPSTPGSRWVGSESRPPKPTSAGWKTRLHGQHTAFTGTEWLAEVVLASKQKLSLFKTQPPPLRPGVKELLQTTAGAASGSGPRV